jgi:hypothetical protein
MFDGTFDREAEYSELNPDRYTPILPTQFDCGASIPAMAED